MFGISRIWTAAKIDRFYEIDARFWREKESMRRTKIKNAEELKRLTLSEAKKAFLQHCKIKNLSEKTIKYYTEDKIY